MSQFGPEKKINDKTPERENFSPQYGDEKEEEEIAGFDKQNDKDSFLLAKTLEQQRFENECKDCDDESIF